MGWLKKLFGKKQPEEPDERKAGEFMGKPVVDMRPEWERQMEHEVQTDLGDEDERYARELCELLRKRDEDAARKIGEKLYASGGHQRMVRVCLRVKALGGDARTLERYAWDGVGEWMG
ncbi:hypothetical protein ACFL09_03220 [Planctomycetota bacterium]